MRRSGACAASTEPSFSMISQCLVVTEDWSLRCNGLQDHRLRRSNERRCVCFSAPDLSLEEAPEGPCFVGGVKVEVDHDVVRIVDRPADALGPDTGLAPDVGDHPVFAHLAALM